MRIFAAALLLAFLAILAGACWQTWPDWWWGLRAPSPEIVFERRINPFLERTCYDCHDQTAHKGGFAIDLLDLPVPDNSSRESWERVLTHVSANLMPPPDEPQPTAADRAQFVSWLDHTLHPIDPRYPDPGRVVIRRLNRQSYQNTIHDLFGIDFDPTDTFPEDDTGYGFDNIASVLSVSPLLLERYLAAAEQIAAAVIPDPSPPPLIYSGAPENWTGGDGDAALYSTNRTLTWTLDLPATGKYRLHLLVAQDQAGNEPARFSVGVDGRIITKLAADGSRRRPRAHDLELDLPAGTSHLQVAFLNDYYAEATAEAKARDRNFYLQNAELTGPYSQPDADPTRIVLPDWVPAPKSSETRTAWYGRVLSPIMRRAWRRPPRNDEITRLAALAESCESAGDSTAAALQVALQAILTSPNFIFLFDADAVAETPPAKSQPISPLSDFALAARLSYFLWDGPPDDRLLDLADEGKLREQLPTVTARLLADPRARRFVNSFAGQWLEVRNLPLRTPDSKLFPEWSPELAASMQEETLLFFDDFLTNRQPIERLLTGDFTFVDNRLAQFYGLPGPPDDGFERRPVPPNRRAGLLGQAGVLAVTSYPNRTSPVLRGKFVLGKLLGTPPPPPPPNIPSLAEHGADGQPATLRQRLELHRANPACATCHSLIDPLGFALENYDAMGRRRELENGNPIDSRGRLVTGETVDSAVSLSAALANGHRDKFHRNFASTLLTYALGRGLDYYDRPTVDKIVSTAALHGHTLPAYIDAVVASIAFQNQRAEPANASTDKDRIALNSTP